MFVEGESADSVSPQPTRTASFSVGGSLTLQGDVKGTLTVRFREGVQPVYPETVIGKHGFEEGAAVKNTVESPGPLPTIALRVHGYVGDALSRESCEEELSGRGEETAEFAKVHTNIVCLHVREHRVEVDDVELSILEGEAKVGGQCLAGWIVSRVPRVNTKELEGWVSSLDIPSTPCYVSLIHVDTTIFFNFSDTAENPNRQPAHPTSHV